MIRILVCANLLVLLIALPGSAAQAKQDAQQKPASVSARSTTASQAGAKSDTGSTTLDAGSQLQAEMSSTVDLKEAKPGDRFKMKTTQPVKRDGNKIINRGSTIGGHIEKITRANNATQANLVFDSITDSKTGLSAQLDAVITAVVTTASSISDMSSTEESKISRSARPSGGQSQGGGLLSGTLNTVGGVAGQVGSTVDSTTSATIGASTGLNSTTGDLSRGAIQIVNDTTAGVTSNSTLALPGKHPRIERGTRFLLQTTSALTLTKMPTDKKAGKQ